MSILSAIALVTSLSSLLLAIYNYNSLTIPEVKTVPRISITSTDTKKRVAAFVKNSTKQQFYIDCFNDDSLGNEFYSEPGKTIMMDIFSCEIKELK